MRDFIKPLGITQNTFATYIGVSGPCIHHIVNGKNRIRAPLALRLEAALGTPARFWLQVQMEYDLYLAKHDEFQAIERREIRRIQNHKLSSKIS